MTAVRMLYTCILQRNSTVYNSHNLSTTKALDPHTGECALQVPPSLRKAETQVGKAYITER